MLESSQKREDSYEDQPVFEEQIITILDQAERDEQIITILDQAERN